MAEFVTIVSGKGTAQAVNLDHVTHVEWTVTAEGRDGLIRVNLINGTLLSVPFSDPSFEAAAKGFGFGAQFAAWPKVKAEAEQRYKAAKEEKALADKRRGLQRA